MSVIYLGSPQSALQADAVRDMPVLLSFGCYPKWKPMTQWSHSYEPLLLDSGAYSGFTSNVEIDLGEYREWLDFFPHAIAHAGLDSIKGDWRLSMKNYTEGPPMAFPTYHNTDPPELLPELIAMAKERSGWIGIGLKPPRTNCEAWLRDTLERLAVEPLKVHGFACIAYDYIPGFDSYDSTNWWRDMMKYRKAMPWLTWGECLEISVKRYKRWQRMPLKDDGQMTLDAAAGGA